MTFCWDGITYQSLVIHSIECGSSPTRMKHKSQVKYADILLDFFLKMLIMGWKLGNTRLVIGLCTFTIYVIISTVLAF